jgi:hypothetical protein
MSVVSNVILSFDAREGEEARLNEVNAYLGEGHTHFQGLEDYAGSKFLERPTFVGAFNYLGVERFIAHIREVKWQYPENVQLFICDQEDIVYIERLHSA